MLWQAPWRLGADSTFLIMPGRGCSTECQLRKTNQRMINGLLPHLWRRWLTCTVFHTTAEVNKLTRDHIKNICLCLWMTASVTGIQTLPTSLGETFRMPRAAAYRSAWCGWLSLLQQMRPIYKSEAKASVDVLGLFGKFGRCCGIYNASKRLHNRDVAACWCGKWKQWQQKRRLSPFHIPASTESTFHGTGNPFVFHD